MSSGSSYAIWLSLTSTVLFELSGSMNEVFNSWRVMKVIGTVDDVLVVLKKTGSHRSKSVTAGSLIFQPSISSTGFLPRVWEIFRCIIRARYRKAPNETIRFGLQA